MEERFLDCTNRKYGEVIEQTVKWVRGLDSLNFHPCHILTRGASAIILSNVDKMRPFDPFRKVYSHSSFKKGFKVQFAKDLLIKDPKRLIKQSIWGYLPKNRSSKSLLKRIKVFKSDELITQKENV